MSLAAGCAVAMAMALMGSAPLHAQTIEDLAKMQRAKINDEILKSKGLPDSQQLAAQASMPVVKALPPPPAVSGLVVHALYSRGSSGRIAELSDGKNLMIAVPGTQYGPYRIVRVSELGVTVAPTRCAKKCAPERTIRLGGTF